jgi:hypothetical protein
MLPDADRARPTPYDGDVYLLMILAVLVMITAAGLAVRFFLRARSASRLLKAVQQYSQDRNSLEQTFFETAAASGKPRGLKWKQCDFHEKSLLAKDRSTGEFYSLTGVTISFEAIAGGGMEDVEAVGNLRCATAVFVYRKGRWTTDGRVIFNLEPHEALQRYHDSLEPMADQNITAGDE